MRAWLNLRYTDDKRAELFRNGLKRLGYKIEIGMTSSPRAGDIFITWNRISAANHIAKQFELEGFPVIVAENASWGNTFAGFNWYHIALNNHNTLGNFSVYGNERFDNLNVELQDWRKSGETVILPQRGIGSPPVKMPSWFIRKAQKEHGGRIRKHPGRNEKNLISLKDDLKRCGKVVTWGSGAAIKAVIFGIPCISYMPKWIGEQNNTDQDRLKMLRNLAWAQWKYEEIKSGEAFRILLDYKRDGIG